MYGQVLGYSGAVWFVQRDLKVDRHRVVFRKRYAFQTSLDPRSKAPTSSNSAEVVGIAKGQFSRLIRVGVDCKIGYCTGQLVGATAAQNRPSVRRRFH